MERFDSIYPFTTENISGYMSSLDLSNKRVITVTGSGDHVINAIKAGSSEITTFDINPLSKNNLDLKLSGIKFLSYEDFLDIFLYDNLNIDKSFIRNSDMPNDSRNFWLEKLKDKSWLDLKKSSLFNRKYFNPESKLWENMYLDEDSFYKVKKSLENANISFINCNLKDLRLTEQFDYMFLSNISDYLKGIYGSDYLKQYYNLLQTFLKNVKEIYFAYLYDFGNNNPRSDIDNIDLIKNEFVNFDKKIFRSALEETKEKEDCVLILRR